MFERQREWPHEAEARIELVLHALPALAATRRSKRWFLPWGRANAAGSPAPPP